MLYFLVCRGREHSPKPVCATLACSITRVIEVDFSNPCGLSPCKSNRSTPKPKYLENFIIDLGKARTRAEKLYGFYRGNLGNIIADRRLTRNPKNDVRLNCESWTRETFGTINGADVHLNGETLKIIHHALLNFTYHVSDVYRNAIQNKYCQPGDNEARDIQEFQENNMLPILCTIDVMKRHLQICLDSEIHAQVKSAQWDRCTETKHQRNVYGLEVFYHGKCLLSFLWESFNAAISKRPDGNTYFLDFGN
ncbi:uncharacterized protein LOC106160743 isoform X2 [Lingula anatina]|nr:uncharacterized protein LOC106160743 isoform X2 [Lingula anatina]XP_013392868.1 uncharacterized protein LOC106160743 isoform X2 [Lingula anatina]|eukprot:XP_013392867.1 uncharacterized protein LOC106160743 isoform X2 [Lingula anatina]